MRIIKTRAITVIFQTLIIRVWFLQIALETLLQHIFFPSRRAQDVFMLKFW